MLNILVFITVFYLAFNFFGFLLEKIRIPKIYAALFLGIIFSLNQSVISLANSPPIRLLADLGMFSLLFLLGFSLDFHELRKQKYLIFKTTFWVILSELFVGTLFLHFFFHVNWVLAGIIAISFATVGEVALLPILKKFKLIKTKLGQVILGVSVLDDVIEITAFILIIFYIGSLQFSEIGRELIPLIAILTGVLISSLSKNSSRISKVINILSLVILGPFFFFYAGTEANLAIIFNQFFVILVLTLLIKGTKLTSAYLCTHKQLGTKKSLILGLSLCIKFSTSIIILIILLQKELISQELFSVLIGIKVLFKLIIPVLLSYLINKWHLELIHLQDN